MSSIKELTGGTGDVNPQYLSAVVTQSAADAKTGVQFILPVPRTSQKPSRTIVVEILKVEFMVDQFDWVFAQNARIYLTASTSSTQFDPDDAQTFAAAAYYLNLTVAAGGIINWKGPIVIDTTDGAGHGFLVAVQAITLGIDSFFTVNVNTAFIKLWYRYKEVALSDFLGIVTTQS